jgi:hypothetical protein
VKSSAAVGAARPKKEAASSGVMMIGEGMVEAAKK